MSTSYAETFVTLPIISEDGEEELTIPATKVQTMRGNAKRTMLTYKDGETVMRATVPRAVTEVRTEVLAKMTDF